MRVKTGVVADRVAPPKAKRAAAKGGTPAKKPVRVWAWYPVPDGFILFVRANGCDVIDLGVGKAVVVVHGQQDVMLVHLRFRDPRFEAQAAGNSPIGRNAIFRDTARTTRPQIDRALRRVSTSGNLDDLLGPLGQARGGYRKAKAYRPEPKPARVPGRFLDATERSSSVRAVSGGLPTLGKRR